MSTSIQTIDSVPQLRTRRLSIVICAAITIYVLSSVKFLVRDPLSSDTGAQGFIEIALLGLAAALVAVAGLMRRTRPTVTPAVVGFALLGILMTVSSVWSYWPALSLIKGVMFFVVLAMAVWLCNMDAPLNIVTYFYWACFGIIFVGLCLRLISGQPLLEVDDYSGRMRLILYAWHPGSLADVSALAMLSGFLLKKRPPRFVFLFCQLFLLAINVATCARASTALLVVVAGVLFAAQYLTTIRGLALSFFALGFVAFGLFVVSNAQWPVVEKLSSSLQVFYGDKLGEDIGTLNGRTDVWKTSSDMIGHSLLLGYGLEGVRDRILQEEAWAGNAHNAYLEVLLAGGAPALLILLVTWAFSAARALRDKTGMRGPVLGIYTYMFFFGFTEPNLTYLQSIAMFLIVCLDYGLRIRPAVISEGRNQVTSESEAYELDFSPETD